MIGKHEMFGWISGPPPIKLSSIIPVELGFILLNVLTDHLVDSTRAEHFDGTISNKAHDNVLTSDLDLAQGNLLLNTFLIIN